MADQIPPSGSGRRVGCWIYDNWFRFATLGLLLAALAILREHLVLSQTAQQRAVVATEASHREQAHRAERAYVARQRMECYDLHARERAQFNNVVGHDYDRALDRCEVIYRHSGRRQINSACQLTRDSTSFLARDTSRFARNLRMDCSENQFRTLF